MFKRFLYFSFQFSRDLSKRKDVKLKANRSKPFWISTLPCEIAAYIAIHTFGIRMIYPGSVKLIQSFLHPVLVQGRAKLVEEEQAKRYKLRTIDNNDVDTIFVDNRNGNINGKTLVICSEGNAGFYEIGIMTTPLSLKYSVLGWNHPGFGGSTVRIQFSMNFYIPFDGKRSYSFSFAGSTVSQTRSKCHRCCDAICHQ